MTAFRSPCHFACLITLAIAVPCESDWAGGAVIAQSSSEANACVACTGLAMDASVASVRSGPKRSCIERATAMTTSGGDFVGIVPRSIQLADASVTGRFVSIDLLLPVDPFWDGPFKPT